MNRKVIAREGLILLATCGALFALAVVLQLLAGIIGITLWPLVAFAPLVLPLFVVVYVLVRWRLHKRSCRA